MTATDRRSSSWLPSSWWPSSTPETLAAMRIVIAAQALWMLLSRDPAGIARLPAVIWDQAEPMYRLRFLLVRGWPGVESLLWLLAVASLVCVLVGWRTRPFAICAAALLYHLAPLQSLLAVSGPWGKGLTIAILTLPILASAPCEDRWSVSRSRGGPPDLAAPAYGWAVMLIRLLFAQIYLFSGLGKLRNAGLDWLSVETIRSHLLVAGVFDPSRDTRLTAWIIERPTICLMLALAVVALELTFVLAVVIRRVRLPLAISAALFHVGLMVTLGYRFLSFPHLLLFLDLGTRGEPSAARGSVR